MKVNVKKLKFALVVAISCSAGISWVYTVSEQECAKINSEPELRQVYNSALEDGNVSTIMWALREDFKNPEASRVLAKEELNLCDIRVAGSNTLFCQTNKGITRIKMPQLSGQPAVGSPADILLHGKELSELKTDNAVLREIVEASYDQDPKKLKIPLPFKTTKDKGNEVIEVDAAEYFKEYLRKHGKTITQKKIPAAKLQATQSELVPQKINEMWWALELGPCNKFYNGIVASIFVSQDNYVLDGHHRWAAVVANAFGTTNIDKVMMNVFQVNEAIGDEKSGLVKMANDFTNDFGIAAKAG